MSLTRGAVTIALAVVVVGFGTVQAQQRGRFAGSFQLAARPIPVSLDSLRAEGVRSAGRPHPQLIRLAVLADASFSADALGGYGWRLIGRVGDVATLEGPASAAPYLGALPGIRYVKMPSRIHPVMDSARRCCFINPVQKTWTGPRLTGKKVLFGIIDTDFDTRHKAFRDSTGKTRFVALWDQVDATKKYPNKYKYGSIANHSQLLTDTAFGLSKGFHGTCMASYAAGGQGDCPYYGVAPDVAIAAVKMGESDQNIIDGLNWLFTLADSLGLPCVINMSLGSAEGPHDGSSLVDRAIDSLGIKPGHVIVGAIGNDGGRLTHATFKLGKGQAAGSFAAPLISSGSRIFQLEMWGQAGKSFTGTFYLLDTASMTYQVAKTSYSTASVPSGTSRAYKIDTVIWTDAKTAKPDTAQLQVIALESASALNGKPHLEIAAISKVPTLFVGVRDSAPTAADTIQVWNVAGNPLRGFQLSGFQDGDTVMSANELGGTAKHNITVGGYISKTSSTLWNGQPTPGNWDDKGVHGLAGFSGRGPTADGRVKPDICAPASNVVGALARDIDSSSVSIMYWPNHPATDDRYAITGGTSCASPIVAGVAAMLLQANPALTADSIKHLLQATAIHDAATGTITSPNNTWGAGKLCALAAVGKFLNISAAHNVPARTTLRSGISLLSGNRVRFSGLPKGKRAYFEYFTSQGRCVRRQPIQADQAVDCYGTLPAGVYFLHVKAGAALLGQARITLAGR